MGIERNDELWQEFILKTEVYVDGIDITPEALKVFGRENKFQEQIHTLFEYDFKTHTGVTLPSGFYLPNGLFVAFRWNPDSKYIIHTDSEEQAGIYIKGGNHLSDIEFLDRPDYFSKKTSDGQPMGNVAFYMPDGCAAACYSNECALKEKGLDCLFCDINATKDTYSELEGVVWRTPRQIGEAMAAAYKEGIVHHFQLTGGLIAERREVEYYLDVAEEIRSQTGLTQYNLTATVGAPHDHRVFEHYKEAGFLGIGINIEVWDKNIWQTICPGKDKECGGWENWVKALEQAVPVFGKWKVRSMIVAGIEPQKKTLEGVEQLASMGVICCPVPWAPTPGSALEGHRTPVPAWHLDLAKKTVAIYRKYGIDYALYHQMFPQFSHRLVNDVLKLEEGLSFKH